MKQKKLQRTSPLGIIQSRQHQGVGETGAVGHGAGRASLKNKRVDFFLCSTSALYF